VSARDQRKAHALLGNLLGRCESEGLPVLHWSIAEHGLLTARCLHDDPAHRLEAFEAWMRALDLGRWPDEERPDGAIRHQAAREGLDGVDVSLIAVIDPEGRS
jgi:aryl-alcohol dehydrogenase-like predicted oxidoreductase